MTAATLDAAYARCQRMAAEAGLDVEEIVKQAVAAAAMEEFDFP